ncbi:translation elongation factor Ts [Patescibacteria group bacterium]|nr:translation elongation factor Ts [Patescibacteria group bacterium]MBU1472900.1 translation elongation factor Ts [Patescibacteria group bacterium]MBU2459801.1 translation elongation factor Ts [Patescibacteria group bacterium]MBU2544822.1 translation elongation factor Ts [Patescibacteria group bacterium]
MHIKLEDIKKLRLETSAGVSNCRKALEDCTSDYTNAKKMLEKRMVEQAAKKKDRTTGVGIIASYVHSNGKIGVLVELRCETDFVARTNDFKNLSHEVALQIAAMDPKNVDTLLKSEYIRDGSLTIESLIKQTITKLGENIVLSRFTRMELE